MRVLAIDPGNTMSAWCVVSNGVPIMFDKVPNASVLRMLRTVWLPGAGSDASIPDLLAVEGIASYGMAVGKEVFDTCRWIGRFEEAWDQSGRAFSLIYRKDVKQFHCGTTRANDANIRAALIDRFGPGREKAVGTKRAQGQLYGIKGDEWSALAVALTAEAALAPSPQTCSHRARPVHGRWHDSAFLVESSP